MSLRGRWRVIETPGYDMAGAGSYIGFDQNGGEFALDCLTGSFYGSCEGDGVAFEWDGNDEMNETSGSGWAELQPDGSLEGEITLQNGDDIPFTAHRQTTSSTAC
jgi:hypothetical protein